MKFLKKFFRRTVIRPFLVVLACFCFFDFYFEFHGLPVSWHPHLQSIFQHADFRVSFTHLRVGILRGVVMLNSTFHGDTPVGPIRLTAREINCRFNLPQLWRGKLIPDSFAVSNGEMTFLAANSEQTMTTSIQRLHGRRKPDDQCQLQMQASCEGISLNGTFTLANFSQFPALLGKDANAPEISFQPAYHEALCRATELIKQCRWGGNDAFIKCTGKMDCLLPETLALAGNFSFGHALLGPLVITKLRGDFALQDNLLQLDRLQWFLSRNELVQGNLTLNLPGKSLSAELHGQLLPATFWYLAQAEHSVPAQISSLTAPIRFSATLPKTSWERDKLQLSLDCCFDAMTFYGIHIHRGCFVMQLNQQELSLQGLSLSLNPTSSEWITGNLEWNLKNNTATAQLAGELPILHLCRQLGLQVPASWIGSERRNLQVRLELLESPLTNWKKWQAEASVEAHNLLLKDVPVQNLHLKVALENEMLTIHEATAKLAEMTTDSVKLTADVNVAKFLTEDTAEINFAAEIYSPPQDANVSSPSPDFTWQGMAIYHHEQRQIQLQGKGSSFPDRLYQAYQAPLKIPQTDILALLRCPQEPIEYTLELPLTDLPVRQQWKVLLDLQARNGSFSTLDLAEASCQVEVNARELHFRNLRGRTAANEPISLEIMLQYEPFLLTLKDISLQGRPEIAEAFIISEPGKTIYQQIWHHVRWSAGHPADIFVPSLVYQSGSTDQDWQLAMHSSMHVTQAYYRDLLMDEINLEVHLDLPESMQIAPITVHRPDGAVEAEISMTFTGVPQCDLKIVKSEGSVDPKEILLSINPDWISFLEPITFSPQTKVTCEGTFFLTGDPMLRLDGRIDTPQCCFHDWVAEDVIANWNISSDHVRWDVTQATHLGGNLKTTGTYDLEAGAGNLLLLADHISLDQFSSRLGLSERNPSDPAPSGYINGECRLSILRNWAGRPYHLEGRGHLAVREADLWSVPLFGKLGYLLELTTFSWLRQNRVSGLGKISQLDADLEFLGNRLTVPQFSTNGTIIALSGEGEYSWEKDRLFFQVSGEALKEVSIVSFVLKPLTWAFHAELAGTRKNNEWKLRTALRKIFSTD